MMADKTGLNRIILFLTRYLSCQSVEITAPDTQLDVHLFSSVCFCRFLTRISEGRSGGFNLFVLDRPTFAQYTPETKSNLTECFYDHRDCVLNVSDSTYQTLHKTVLDGSKVKWLIAQVQDQKIQTCRRYYHVTCLIHVVRSLCEYDICRINLIYNY